jgi:hypothetical protein
MSRQELEWFELETKMREQLYSQLLPMLNRSKEDKEELISIKSYCIKLESRLQKLETMIFKDKDQETVIQSIYNRYAEIEGNRKSDSIKVQQKLELAHEKLKSVDFNLSDINETLAKFNTKFAAVESEINKAKELMESNKEIVLKEIGEIGMNFKALNNTYTTLASKAEEKSGIAFESTKTTALEVAGIKKQLESLWKSHNDNLVLSKELKATKLSTQDYAKSTQSTQETFKKINETLQTVKNELYMQDRHTDKYLPLKIAAMISNYLFSILDSESIQKLIDYENLLFMELNKNTLSNLHINKEEQANRILKEVQDIEQKKFKVIRNFKSKEKNKRADSDLNISDLGKETFDFSTHPAYKKLVEDLLTKVDVEISKFKHEFIEKIDKLNSECFYKTEQTATLLKQVLLELPDTKNERIKEKVLLSKEISNLKATVQENKSILSVYEEVLTKISNVILNAVEIDQIHQMLDAQDEEDRHNIAQTYNKTLKSTW